MKKSETQSKGMGRLYNKNSPGGVESPAPSEFTNLFHKSCRCAGVDSILEQKKLEARKMLVVGGTDSHKSAGMLCWAH
jgi:hypothetical protein